MTEYNLRCGDCGVAVQFFVGDECMIAGPFVTHTTGIGGVTSHSVHWAQSTTNTGAAWPPVMT